MNSFILLAQKMSSNRYLSAIRDGFLVALPLTLAAAFAILFNNVVLANNLPYALSNPQYYSAQFIEVIQGIKMVFTSIEFGCLHWLSPLVLMGIAYTLSTESHAKNPFINALIVFAAFLALLPKGSLVTGGYWQNQFVDGYARAQANGMSTVALSDLFGSANLFTAIFVGIIFTELLLKLQGLKPMRFNLSEHNSASPLIADAFATIMPAFLTIFSASIIAAMFMYFKPLGFGDLSTFISGIVQKPFLALARTSLGGLGLLVVYVCFANLLWLFGLNGPSILAGLAGPTLTTLSLNNQAIYAQTGDAFAPELSTFTMGFVETYTQFGGAGAILGLLIAIYLISKRKDYRAISKAATIPALFEIHEPATFGLPVVLNPILGIPFVLAPLISILIPGILTLMGWLPKVVVAVPWVVPPVVNAFLATGASWRAAFVGIVNIVLITLVYLPFVMITNKAVDTSEVKIAAGSMNTVKNTFAKLTKKSTLKMKSKEKANSKKVQTATLTKKDTAKPKVTTTTKITAKPTAAPKKASTKTTSAKPKAKPKSTVKKPATKTSTKTTVTKQN